MLKTLRAIFASIFLGMVLVSCGSSRSTQHQSGLSFRAFVSNPVHPGVGSISPALDVIDATRDVDSGFVVTLTPTVPDAGMMVESPKRDRTVVYSPSDTALALVNNAQESASSTAVNLPGATESMLVGSDDTTLFAAVPSAPVAGQAAGAVVLIDITSAATTATVPVAGAHFLALSPGGNQVLVTSDSTNSITVLNPNLIAQGGGVATLSGFDKPVGAVFSGDGTTAYVLNCGPECGGVSASVAVVDMTQSPPVLRSQVAVAAATTGLLSGSTLYVAGTPPSAGANCQSSLCGALTAIAVSSSGLSPSPPQPITDGYHNHLLMAPNGQLFIGSKTCTNVAASGTTPARGCLSVLNIATGTVYTAPQTGDVTGMEAIAKRTVVYVCEGGGLTIYDTASDLSAQGHRLAPQLTQITIVGQAVDVKLVDF